MVEFSAAVTRSDKIRTAIAVTPHGVPMLVRVKAAPVSPGPPVPRWRGARRRAFATW
ncbi:hypothetical protein ACFWMR_41580 [Amycolatopsis thailandensis]|uniref:hypothetical protein n=1 Tax=Amycolatopsis thailandensis TaxID=589330 RepID=UPI0036497267